MTAGTQLSVHDRDVLVPAGASACTATRSTSQPCSPDSGSVSRKSTRDQARLLHALRSWIHRLGTENLATNRQPLRPRDVTHVL